MWGRRDRSQRVRSRRIQFEQYRVRFASAERTLSGRRRVAIPEVPVSDLSKVPQWPSKVCRTDPPVSSSNAPLDDCPVRFHLTGKGDAGLAVMRMAKHAKSRSRRKQTARDPLIPEFCYCSFCLKSEDHVKYLIAGPGNIFICEECVSFCNEIIDVYNAGHTHDFSKARCGERLPTERLLSQLRSINDTLQGKSTQIQWAIDTLRSRKISWGRIAEAMGVSRQSAWERFS